LPFSDIFQYKNAQLRPQGFELPTNKIAVETTDQKMGIMVELADVVIVARLTN
jgi:hypothetical protein